MSRIHIRLGAFVCLLAGAAVTVATLAMAGVADDRPGLQADSVAAPGTDLFASGFEFRPNILLVIMDDVGIDQMPAFGYGGPQPPEMPSIDAIAADGLRFRNTWSMPECSPGRSVLLTGRYPLRNNVMQALGPNDLANSQISPFEVTVPKLLRAAGYRSALFGKFHLAGPEHNWAGNATPSQLGWEHFHGWTGGLPGSIDTTAGGVAPADTYSCGFVPDRARDPVHGADSGACHVPEAGGGFHCLVLAGADAAGDPPGLQCLARGGILVPDAACDGPPPAYLDWQRENAHYVSPLVINDDGQVEEVPLVDPRSRGYRSTLEVDAAIDWIQQQADSPRPWMATLSFSAAHTPLHPAPGALLPSGIAAELGSDCRDMLTQRRLTDAMIQAMDTELGRLLVATGIARAGADGGLVYDPVASNTVVVIYGDNGSFGPTVKAPFDPTRAKGTAYQTGVWVPLVVAGPMVSDAGRDIGHMVNGTDVFRLFAELAGLDVAAWIPRRIDARPMLPYLLDPAQAALRDYNFVQGDLNLQVDDGRNGPCVIGNLCSHTPVSKSVCEDNGGIWWGQGADHDSVIQGGLEQCWQVNQAIYHDDPGSYDERAVTMGWTTYQAIRNNGFKLVRNRALHYDPIGDDGIEVAVEEFYRINQAVPLPLLDRADRNLLDNPRLTRLQALNHAALSQQLDDLLASQVPCPGDGNDDRRVDQADLDTYHWITGFWTGSSTYDFNLDGQTDADDLAVIQDHLGTVCPPPAP